MLGTQEIEFILIFIRLRRYLVKYLCNLILAIIKQETVRRTLQFGDYFVPQHLEQPEKPWTTETCLKSPSLLESRSQRLFVYKFLGLDCFMLISFTLINLEISLGNDFLKAFIDNSAELCNLAAFIFFIIQNSSYVGSQKTCFLQFCLGLIEFNVVLCAEGIDLCIVFNLCKYVCM